MKKYNKLGRVYLINATVDAELQVHDFQGWHCVGSAKYKIGKFGKTKKVNFMTMNNRYKIAFQEKWGTEIPANKEDRRNLLLMLYSKYGEMRYFIDLKTEFLKEDKEEQEDKERVEVERKAREIAVGEQISIEKYIKNLEVVM